MVSLKRPALLHTAAEPIELLSKCHDRMRDFVGMALRLAAGRDAPAPQIVEAANALHRYFTVALPLHEEDEERSIAPRLLATRARAEVEDALATMAEEHASAHELLAWLEPTWARVAAEPPALAALSSDLEAQSRALGRLFDAHLAMEESRIFPAMQRELARAEREAILAEMRGRRGQETIDRLAPIMRG